jgi:light-regulated signal transduction histidine kinase (bacteriophytochrome)
VVIDTDTRLGRVRSRKFIEMNGGRTRVKSEMGMGSTFMFTTRARPEA